MSFSLSLIHHLPASPKCFFCTVVKCTVPLSPPLAHGNRTVQIEPLAGAEQFLHNTGIYLVYCKPRKGGYSGSIGNGPFFQVKM